MKNFVFGLIILSIFLFAFTPHQPKSISIGSPGKGKLINGVKVPYKGKNYKYFSLFSSVLGRNYVNHRVKNCMLATYKKLENIHPERKWHIMECSNKKGGKIIGHITHQNGLSVDFETPMKKKGKPYYGHSKWGIFHYLLRYNDHGHWPKNKKVQVDFEAMARHIYELAKEAPKHGLKVKKVILKLELKDELYATKYGKRLKRMGVYFAMRLPKVVNNMHDDHYHIDFQVLKSH